MKEWKKKYLISLILVLFSLVFINNVDAISYNDTIIDCNGSMLNGDGSPNSYGISLSNNESVTIMNCNINGFTWGIRISSSPNVLIINNNITNNIKYGMGIFSSDNVTIMENNINHNGEDGIWVNGGDSNTLVNLVIKDNIISNNGYNMSEEVEGYSGINLYDAMAGYNYTTITNNIIINNTFRGLSLPNTHHSNISGNTLEKNKKDGLNLNGHYNLIYDNNLISNNLYGIYLSGSNAIIWKNYFITNKVSAFETSNSTDNQWNITFSPGVGNYWDDFEENEGYPNYYVIPGEGGGIDYHPIVEEEEEETTESPSSGGSSGGGGGGGSSSSEKEEVIEELIIEILEYPNCREDYDCLIEEVCKSVSGKYYKQCVTILEEEITEEEKEKVKAELTSVEWGDVIEEKKSINIFKIFWSWLKNLFS